MSNFKSSLHALSILIRMQLKERLEISFKNNIKKSLLKMSIYLLLLAGLTALIYLIFYIFLFLGILGVGGYLPVSLFNIVFFILMTFTTISCINRFTDALYFSKDNSVLLTYAVNNSTIFLSKLIVFYILELIRNFALFIPLFIAYGISCYMPWYYFFWVIFCFFIITLVPIAIASLFSIVHMYIKIMFRKYDLAKGLTILLLIVIGTVLMFYLVNLLPEDLQISLKWATVYYPAIISFSQVLEKYLFIFTFLSTIVFGYTIGGINNPRFLGVASPKSLLALALTLLGCAIVIVLSSFFVKANFLKMAASSFEHDDKKETKVGKDYQRKPLLSILYLNVLSDVRTPSRLISNYLMFAAAPMATLTINAIFKAIHTSTSGQLYILVVNFILIILITCSANVSTASLYSKEGESAYLNQSSPISLPLMLSAKLIIKASIMSLSILITMLIYHSKLSVAYSRFDLMLFIFLFIYLGHLFWSAELDYRHPKINLYKEMGDKGNIFNPNEMLSFLFAILIAISSLILWTSKAFWYVSLYKERSFSFSSFNNA